MALAAYRHILRSARIAFQGDTRVLSAARTEARCKFDSHRFLAPESLEAGQKIAEAEEIAKILLRNIVQGEQIARTANNEQRYQLRIHPEIERGDNDSIKKPTDLTAAGGSYYGGAS